MLDFFNPTWNIHVNTIMEQQKNVLLPLLMEELLNVKEKRNKNLEFHSFENFVFINKVGFFPYFFNRCPMVRWLAVITKM